MIPANKQRQRILNNKRSDPTNKTKQENKVAVTVLVDEHADANARHIETIEEVVDPVLHRLVDLVRFAHLDDTFGHGRNDVGVPVPNLYQRLTEPFKFH